MPDESRPPAAPLAPTPTDVSSWSWEDLSPRPCTLLPAPGEWTWGYGYLVVSSDDYRYAAGSPPEVAEWIVHLEDPVDDLAQRAGRPASGPAWQDVTGFQLVCAESDDAGACTAVRFTIFLNGSFPLMSRFRDGSIMILIDVNGDAEPVPPQGPIDFYAGNFDYGVFISSPEFNEPSPFVQELQKGMWAPYDTEAATFQIEGARIEITVSLDHIGSPEGEIGVVAAVRTGIMGTIIEDRVPDAGPLTIELPTGAFPGSPA